MSDPSAEDTNKRKREESPSNADAEEDFLEWLPKKFHGRRPQVLCPPRLDVSDAGLKEADRAYDKHQNEAIELADRQTRGKDFKKPATPFASLYSPPRGKFKLRHSDLFTQEKHEIALRTREDRTHLIFGCNLDIGEVNSWALDEDKLKEKVQTTPLNPYRMLYS